MCIRDRLTQFDRLILPRIVPLDQFGAYVLAALVAAMPARFSAPMFSALLPRLAALVEGGAALAGVVARASSLLAALSFATAAGLTWLGESLLGWWSGDEKATALAMIVMPCLAYGSAFNACSTVPAALLLARGRTRLMVGINLAWVVLQPIALIELVARFGLAAAGWVWLALNVSYILLLGPAALAGRNIGFGRWLGGALLWPAIAAMPAAWLAARYLPVQDHGWHSAIWLSLGGLGCLVCAGAAGMVWLRWNRWYG